MNNQTLPKHFELLPGEQLVEIIHPHPFAFYRTYAVWVIAIVVSIAMVVFKEAIVSLFPASHVDLPVEIINTLMASQSTFRIGSDLLSQPVRDSLLLVTAWWYMLLPLSAAVSLAKVNGGWILVFLGIVGISTVAGIATGALTWIPLFGAVLCLGGMLVTEIYRRSHYFIITNLRLVMHVDLLHLQQRDLLLSRLSDLAIDQSLVGRLFNFGTLIPISLSGFGLGSDMAMVGVGGQAGPVAVGGALGTSIGVPRARSPHVLFGVPGPHEVHAVLEKLIYANSEVRHLQTISDDLKRMKFLTSNDEIKP